MSSSIVPVRQAWPLDTSWRRVVEQWLRDTRVKSRHDASLMAITVLFFFWWEDMESCIESRQETMSSSSELYNHLDPSIYGEEELSARGRWRRARRPWARTPPPGPPSTCRPPPAPSSPPLPPSSPTTPSAANVLAVGVNWWMAWCWWADLRGQLKLGSVRWMHYIARGDRVGGLMGEVAALEASWVPAGGCWILDAGTAAERRGTWGSGRSLLFPLLRRVFMPQPQQNLQEGSVSNWPFYGRGRRVQLQREQQIN